MLRHQLVLALGAMRVTSAARQIILAASSIALSTLVSDPAEPSDPLTVEISGVRISEEIVVAPLTGFEYSLDGETYADTLSIPASGGTLYIRLKGGTADATLTGDIVISSGDVSVTISAYGTVGETIMMLNATDWLMWDSTDDIKLCNGI